MLAGTSWHSFLCLIHSLTVVSSFHSGAQPITPATTTAVSANAFAAALKEYEEDSETETDGEGGE